MLPTLHCLSGQQEWLAQLEPSKLQESQPKLPHMAGNLLGSGMARLGVQSAWFGIAQCQEPISRQAGGVLFENSARCTNSPVPRERENV